VVFNREPYTVLPDNSILITANMQSETGFPSSHQLKYYVASKSRLKLAARAVLSADAGLLVTSNVQRILLAAGRRTQAGDATDQWRDQWRRRLECVIKARIDNRKNLLSSNISSTCPHNMVNLGLLAAEIVSLV